MSRAKIGRTTEILKKLQSRCVSCQYSFPNETYLLKHDCRGYQDAADYDDQAIDNIITDSLETEVDIEFEAPKIQTYQPEEDQGKVRLLRKILICQKSE